MKDFLKNYKKRKIISNTWVIFASLVLALWINFFLIDSTNLWNSLKASVLNSTSNKDLSDVYLVKNWDKISLKNSKKMENIENLSLSFNYNPENIKIEKISSSIEWINILNLANDPWINSLIIKFSWNKNINLWTNIIDITTSKKIEKSESLNLINANFTDTKWTNFSLSTSGISF